MDYVDEAKKYQQLVNRMCRMAREAMDGVTVTEDEVLFRLHTLEGLLRLLSNDARELLDQWEDYAQKEDDNYVTTG